MPTTRSVSVLALVATLTVSGGVTAGLAAQEGSDERKVRQVLRDYVEGWRDGDVERLRRVFAPNGQVMWLSSPGGGPLNTMSFEQVLERRKVQPEFGRSWEVLSLDVVDGQLAVAKLSISRAGGSYVDYLVLQKFDAWRIVSKAFVVRASGP